MQVGLECDQVRKNVTGNGVDISVPISAAYNHHFSKHPHYTSVAGEETRF